MLERHPTWFNQAMVRCAMSQEGGFAPGPESQRAAEFLASGRQAWPDVHIPDEARFAAHLARLTQALPTHAADLYLAFACVAGDPAANQIFQRSYLDLMVPQATSKLSAEAGRELRQALAVRLVVGDGDRPPLLLKYEGLGSLSAWVRTVVRTTVIDVLREEGARKQVSEMALEDALLAASGEESILSAIQAPRREAELSAFKQLLREAIAELAVEDRNLLRMYWLDGLPLKALKDLIGVKAPSTVQRQLQKLNRRIEVHVRHGLEQRGLTDSRFASLFVSFLGHFSQRLDEVLTVGISPDEPPPDGPDA
jgi:RNA polymerase sigma-70 factor, ECF subfamily